MDWFNTIKNFYDEGFYKVDQVKIFVAKGKIAAVDFKNITGQDYTA